MLAKKRILITAYPFTNNIDSFFSKDDFRIFRSHCLRKPNREETIRFLKDIDPHYIIADTETYDVEILNFAKSLQVISRVGIGVDSIDQNETTRRNIQVYNTPDAPTIPVADLTIAQMINMCRRVPECGMGNVFQWNRYIGKDIRDCIIGIIGFGRIGQAVYQRLQAFSPKEIMINDIDEKKVPYFHRSTKEIIYSSCDIITIHVPKTKLTFPLVGKDQFDLMRSDVCLMNMSRGGIIDESELMHFLLENPETRVALDVYCQEPIGIAWKSMVLFNHQMYMTPHLGSATKRGRNEMESGAIQNLWNHIEKENFNAIH